MLPYKKLIFVCTDNLCRSIMAEAIMDSVKGERVLQVASRGLVVLFPEPLDPRAAEILREHEIEPAKEYSQEFIPEEDIEDGTLILTMSEKEKQKILEKKDSFPYPIAIDTLGHFAEQPGDADAFSDGAIADYGTYYEYMDLLVKVAAQKLFREQAEY